jgi:hypothetical protein
MRTPQASDAYRLLIPARKGQLLAEEWLASRRRGSRPRLFNMDLHIAVIRDLRTGLKGLDTDLTSWSLSRHNGLVRRAYRFADPVAIVNARSWQRLDANMIDRFRDRYARYLASFDGFVTTLPPAFAELYADTGKPQLVVAATRYEAPYSDRPADWTRLNAFLETGVADGTVQLVANNVGDADYLAHFTGLTPRVVPSVCDYLTESPATGNGRAVVLGRPGPAVEKVIAAGKGGWATLADAYGTPYAWEQLASSTEVLVLPYNISTMTLFELASAGTPVAVPSPGLAKQLAAADPSILSELSYFQVRRLSAASLSPDDPNNFSAPGFLDWWLSRADFYDTSLMPNVRVIETLDELSEAPQDRRQVPGYWDLIRSRNRRLRQDRRNLLISFLEQL